MDHGHAVQLSERRHDKPCPRKRPVDSIRRTLPPSVSVRKQPFTFPSRVLRFVPLMIAFVSSILASTSAAGAGDLIANPGSVSFGNVVLGASSTQTVTVLNIDTTPVRIMDATVAVAGFEINGLSLP